MQLYGAVRWMEGYSIGAYGLNWIALLDGEVLDGQ
jgi:hypothetical protein